VIKLEPPITTLFSLHDNNVNHLCYSCTTTTSFQTSGVGYMNTFLLFRYIRGHLLG